MTAPQRLVVTADGGSRGNPGPAGYGAVVSDADSGEVLAEVSDTLGRATNNVAEYRGLIAGLEAARDLAPSATVDVRLDSKLVVEQVSGRWRVKHPDLQPLAVQAVRLLSSFPSWTASWIPRARNSHADRLANEAMDGSPRPWAGAGSPVLPPAEPAREVTPARAEPDPTSFAPATSGRGSGWTAASSVTTRTLLLRHGATPLTAARRFSGTGDPDLSQEGHAQARAAAQRLTRDGGVELVVTSPLARARQTAEVVARSLGVDLVEERGLREVDFGQWEGLTFSEIRERHPEELEAWMADPAVAPPGGESFAEVAERVVAARDRLVAAHAGATLLLVTHVTPVKTLLRLALEAPPSALYRLHLDACSLSVVDWHGDGPATVRLVNDTAHLQG